MTFWLVLGAALLFGSILFAKLEAVADGDECDDEIKVWLLCCIWCARVYLFSS